MRMQQRVNGSIGCCGAPRRATPGLRRHTRALANVSTSTQTATFPASYEQAVRQAQESVKQAIADGKQLIEVEFPSTSLDGVSGDGEGMNEMNANMQSLRSFVGAWRDVASSIRVFWPDNVELDVATLGQTLDPAAGRASMDATFDNTSYKMGFLTKQNALWSTIGLNLSFGGQKKFSPVQQVQDSDKIFIVAYPSFNPREELSATNQLWVEAAQPKGIPLIVWQGELDRVRGGNYYPALFFPELAKLSATLIPQFTTAYYVHNFKGSRPGTLFRAYPGPWCVYRRNTQNDKLKLIWTSDTMPTLKQVALEILASDA